MKKTFLCAAALSAAVSFGLSLEDGFRNPPQSARPQAWWHWMNGNVSREGITADLEWMAAAGLGGATLFDAGCGVPAPSNAIAFASADWYAMVRHATSEAKRLGLEIVTPTCSGWSSSGGPWIPPEMAMKLLCHAETNVVGAGRREVKLPPLPNPHGYAKDVATLAVPVPPAERETMRRAEVVVTSPSRNVRLFAFPKPYEARGLFFRLEHPKCWEIDGEVTVEASDDGKTFTQIAAHDANVARRADMDFTLRYAPFPKPTAAKFFRATFEFSTYAADKRDAKRVDVVKVCDAEVSRRVAISDLADKTLAKRVPTSHAPEAPSDAVVAKGASIDVTRFVGADGVLRWDAPAGEWRIVRLGYANNGRCNHPASDHGGGLEVDKLSAKAVGFHFDSYSAKLEGVKGFLVDSYEIGCQNWTDGFPDHFRRLRGYDLAPYLPVLAGVVVGSVGESERFLADFRRTIADLFVDGYAGELARKCHAKGLTLSLEPYGNCPCDDLEYGDFADVPMGEFWSRVDNGPGYVDVGNARMPSYLAHVWGRRYVGAEAFTSATCKWRTTPFLIKAQGDRAFASGVNRLIFHCSTHQPWTSPARRPGATLGTYGMFINRSQTWSGVARPWMDYLARCQWMLQEGTFAADVLFWHGEEIPSRGGHLVGYPEDYADVPVPDGFARDVCSTRALKRLRVEDGKVVAPGGVKYSLLVLQDVAETSPSTLAEIDRLISSGAKIAAPRCPARCVGLADGDDAPLAARAETVWAKGVVKGAAAEGIAALGLAPDFRCLAPSALAKDVAYLHRVHADGSHVYFVACPNLRAETFTCSFRVDGFAPEIWDAESGRIGIVPSAWRRIGGRTEVTFALPPSGSTFVVFRKRTDAAAGGAANATGEPRVVAAADGEWKITFPIGWYDGGTQTKSVTIPSLVDWTTLADDDLRYFSGTATYECELKFPAERVKLAPGKRCLLDLGDVREFAEVSVDGREFPALWRPPFRVDVTDAVAAAAKRRPNVAGETTATLSLRVRVTNLWPNRMIGDDRLCVPDCEWWGKTHCGLKSIPAFVRDGLPSPTGRKTFSTWRFWTKDDELLPSGLLSPVTLVVE